MMRNVGLSAVLAVAIGAIASCSPGPDTPSSQPAGNPGAKNARPVDVHMVQNSKAAFEDAEASPPSGAPSNVLRVGTSGDYPPFSLKTDDGYEGFDIEIARAYAKDRGYELELVPFRWAELIGDLQAGRFDVAMSGVTVRAERSVAGLFTRGTVVTGSVAILPPSSTIAAVEELDHAERRIVVNGGGHLEATAREHFPEATVIALHDNAAVHMSMLDRSADAVISDNVEASIWARHGRGDRILGPFTRDRKAYLVRSNRPDLAADLDAWILEYERSGLLVRTRMKHFEPSLRLPTALPFQALMAALDERLGLMPAVAEAKRGMMAVLDSSREEVVMKAGLKAFAQAAARAGIPAPPEDKLRAFLQAQMDAAKLVQARVLTFPRRSSGRTRTMDLERTLRPALTRLTSRIAFLLIEARRSPEGVPRETEHMALAATEALARPGLGKAELAPLVAALEGVLR